MRFLLIALAFGCVDLVQSYTVGTFVSPALLARSCCFPAIRRCSGMQEGTQYFRASTPSGTVLPDWDQLNKGTSSVLKKEILGSTIASGKELPVGRIVLFRDRNGWCPYSERVWLAMTHKGLDFDEVLINLQGGKPSWYSSVVPTGNTPAILDKDGQVVYDSLRILRHLEERYPEPSLLPSDPAARPLVDDLLAAFAKAMPQGARPSSRGAFLYRGSGLPLPQAAFEASLSAIEGLLARAGGPLFLGAAPTMVDFAWAPFLERWRVQAPLLHPALARLFPDPAGGAGALPRLAEWYAAMDARVPCYLARVKGDAHTWALALAGAGGGGVAAPHDGRPPPDADWLRAAAPPPRPDGVWAAYAAAAGAPATAGAEAAARLGGNRRAVLDDACAALGVAPGPGPDRAVADGVLRAAAALLVDPGPPPAAGADRRAVELLAAAGALGDGAGAEARARLTAAAAAHVGDRVCVPRDMGLLPAAELRAALARLRRAAGA